MTIRESSKRNSSGLFGWKLIDLAYHRLDQFCIFKFGFFEIFKIKMSAFSSNLEENRIDADLIRHVEGLDRQGHGNSD